MHRQRNNIAALPYEQRRLVSRMLFEGAKYAEIRAAVMSSTNNPHGTLTLHNSSLMAWSKSLEYTRYRTAREQDEAETAVTRAQAEALNDGRGPESMADLTVMEVVKELYKQTKGGAITDLGDLAEVTKALAPLLRVGIARDLAATKTRENDLKKEIEILKAAHDAERISLEQEIDRLQKENTKLVEKLEKKSGTVDPAARHTIIAAVDEFVGRPQQ